MAAASSECESPHMHRRSRLSRALKPSHGACLQQASLKAEPAPRVRASASGARPGACCALPPLRRRRGGGSRRPGAAPLRRGGERAERGPARPRGPPRGWPSARLTGSGGGSRGRLPPAGERGGRGAGAAAAAAEPLRAGNPAGLRRRARLPRGYREEESGSGKGCGPRGRNEGLLGRCCPLLGKAGRYRRSVRGGGREGKACKFCAVCLLKPRDYYSAAELVFLSSLQTGRSVLPSFLELGSPLTGMGTFLLEPKLSKGSENRSVLCRCRAGVSQLKLCFFVCFVPLFFTGFMPSYL